MPQYFCTKNACKWNLFLRGLKWEALLPGLETFIARRLNLQEKAWMTVTHTDSSAHDTGTAGPPNLGLNVRVLPKSVVIFLNLWFPRLNWCSWASLILSLELIVEQCGVWCLWICCFLLFIYLSVDLQRGFYQSPPMNKLLRPHNVIQVPFAPNVGDEFFHIRCIHWVHRYVINKEISSWSTV